jgi:hypothetical protein
MFSSEEQNPLSCSLTLEKYLKNTLRERKILEESMNSISEVHSSLVVVKRNEMLQLSIRMSFFVFMNFSLSHPMLSLVDDIPSLELCFCLSSSVSKSLV